MFTFSWSPKSRTAKNTCLIYLYINLIFGQLYDMLIKRGEGLSKNITEEFIEQVRHEIPLHCAVIQYRNDDLKRHDDFIVSYIKLLNEYYQEGLSLCLIETKLGLKLHDRMQTIREYILRNHENQNDSIDDCYIVNDIRKVNTETYKDLLGEEIKKRHYKIHFFIYNYAVVLKSGYLINYMFKCRSRWEELCGDIDIYLALPNIFYAKNFFIKFGSLLDHNNDKVINRINGYSLKLAYEIYSKSIVVKKNYFGAANFVNRKKNKRFVFDICKNEIKEKIIIKDILGDVIKPPEYNLKGDFFDFIFSMSKIDYTYSFFDYICKKTKGKFDIKEIISISILYENMICRPYYSTKYILFAKIGKSVLYNGCYYQKIIAFENDNYEYYSEYIYCYNYSPTGQNTIRNKFLQKKLKEFDQMINLLFSNMLKCTQDCFFTNTGYLFKNKNWLSNEIYLSKGNKDKYTTSFNFLDILNLDNSKEKLIVILKNQLVNFKPFYFKIQRKYLNFKEFYQNLNESMNSYCLDIAITTNFKAINCLSKELGLHLVIKEGNQNVNYYLFFVPELIFDFKKGLLDKNFSYSDKIVKILMARSHKLSEEIYEYLYSFVTDPNFSRIFESNLVNCLFMNDICNQKKYINHLIDEVWSEIFASQLFDDENNSEIKELRELNIILCNIIFDDIFEVIKKVKQDKESFDTIIYLESDRSSYFKHDTKILEAIKTVYPDNIKN